MKNKLNILYYKYTVIDNTDKMKYNLQKEVKCIFITLGNDFQFYIKARGFNYLLFGK